MQILAPSSALTPGHTGGAFQGGDPRLLAALLRGAPVDVKALEGDLARQAADAMLAAPDGDRDGGLTRWLTTLERRTSAAVCRQIVDADPNRPPAGPNLTSNAMTTPLEVGSALLSECDAADLVGEADEGEPPSLPLLGRSGYVMVGWSHLLASYPRAGKTELLVACVREWLGAGRRVLYITEESRNLWRLRARKWVQWPRGLQLVFGLGRDPAALQRRMVDGGEDVVIVDTIRNLLCLVDERDNSEVARVLSPWVAGAREGDKTLILVHHMRKGAGEHGEGIAGGHALLGIVDVGLELRHEEHGASNRRTIKAYARLVQPAELLYERTLADGTMRALGDPATVEREALVRRLCETVGPEWLKTKQVLDALADPKPSDEQARKTLTDLARQGVLDRDPSMSVENVAGRTVKWRAANLPPTPDSSSGRLGLAGAEVRS